MERAAYITPKIRLLGEKEAWARANGKLPPSVAAIGFSTKTHGRAFTCLNGSWLFSPFRVALRGKDRRKNSVLRRWRAYTRAHAHGHLLLASFEGPPNTCCSCGGWRQTHKWSETSLICVESDLATPNVHTSNTQWDLKHTYSTMTRWINLISLDIHWHTYTTISPWWQNTHWYFCMVELHSTVSLFLGSDGLFTFPVSTTTSIMLK